MRRVRWTEEERAALVEAMVEVLREQPHIARLELLRAAQNARLPPSRRRKVEHAVVYQIRDLFEQARAVAKERKAPPPVVAPPETPPPAPEPTLADLVERLADQLANRVVLRLLEALPAELFRAAPDLTEERVGAPNVEAERVGRPGVLVVGLLGAQAETIRRMFPQLNISALTADEALARDVLRRAHTVLMTKFINHSVQDKYRKAANLRFCNGGVSELATLLSNIPAKS